MSGKETLGKETRQARDSLAQKQLQRFGLSMLVLVVSIVLYYLGFFGTYQGPLHPEKIGDGLDAFGLNQWHFVCGSLLLSLFSLSWNWPVNLFCRVIGRRLVCLHLDRKSSAICADPIQRKRRHGDSGRPRFVCTRGHQEETARFLPLRKGPWSYAFGLFWLLIAVMVLVWS